MLPLAPVVPPIVENPSVKSTRLTEKEVRAREQAYVSALEKTLAAYSKATPIGLEGPRSGSASFIPQLFAGDDSTLGTLGQEDTADTNMQQQW